MKYYFSVWACTCLLVGSPSFACADEGGVMVMDTGLEISQDLHKFLVIHGVFDIEFMQNKQITSFRPPGSASRDSLLRLNSSIPAEILEMTQSHVLQVAQAFAQTDRAYTRSRRLVPVLDPVYFFLLAAIFRKGFDSIDDADRLMTDYVADLHQIIAESNTRVVVRSLTSVADQIRGISHHYLRNDPSSTVHLEDLLRKHLLKLVRDNPRTAFIVAAGNLAREIEREAALETAILGEPNVLAVAALNDKGNLTDYSSWSSTYVRVATDDRVLDVSEREVNIRVGTSYAAPRVAAELGKYMRQHPALEAGAAIIGFLDERTKIDPLLAGRIQGGRVLATFEKTCQTALRLSFRNALRRNFAGAN